MQDFAKQNKLKKEACKIIASALPEMEVQVSWNGLPLPLPTSGRCRWCDCMRLMCACIDFASVRGCGCGCNSFIFPCKMHIQAQLMVHTDFEASSSAALDSLVHTTQGFH